MSIIQKSQFMQLYTTTTANILHTTHITTRTCTVFEQYLNDLYYTVDFFKQIQSQFERNQQDAILQNVIRTIQHALSLLQQTLTVATQELSNWTNMVNIYTANVQEKDEKLPHKHSSRYLVNINAEPILKRSFVKAKNKLRIAQNEQMFAQQYCTALKNTIRSIQQLEHNVYALTTQPGSGR